MNAAREARHLVALVFALVFSWLAYLFLKADGYNASFLPTYLCLGVPIYICARLFFRRFEY